MKKIFFTFLFLTGIVLMSRAQDSEAGRWFIGGGVDYSHFNDKVSDENKQSGTSISFSPEAGYMVTPHLALGIGVSYASNINTVFNASGSKNKTSSYGFGGFLFSEYYMELAHHFEFFGFGELEYGISDNKPSRVKGPDASTFEIEAGPGLAYSFSPHFELLMKWGVLGYEMEKKKSKYSGEARTENINTFHFKADLSDLQFALHYYF